MHSGWGRLRAAEIRRGTATIGLVMVLVSLCVTSLTALDRLERSDPYQEKLYYPSGKHLRQIVVGFREPAADYLWFQLVQYYGGYRKGEHDLRYFRGLGRAIVGLDPYFVEAYYFLALVLAMDMGDREGAIDILRTGILYNPDRWQLPFEIGFIHYVIGRDFKRAAVWFEAAARSPDASDFVRRFAAFARKRAGDLEVSVALWHNLYETTKDPYMKRLAEGMIEKCREKLGQKDAAGKHED
jgi:tetratricopeptide (TPR) repeat protein